MPFEVLHTVLNNYAAGRTYLM